VFVIGGGRENMVKDWAQKLSSCALFHLQNKPYALKSLSFYFAVILLFVCYEQQEREKQDKRTTFLVELNMASVCSDTSRIGQLASLILKLMWLVNVLNICSL
jgi:hypothetical protein